MRVRINQPMFSRRKKNVPQLLLLPGASTVHKCRAQCVYSVSIVAINLINLSPPFFSFTNISKWRVTDKVDFKDNSGISFFISQENAHCNPPPPLIEPSRRDEMAPTRGHNIQFYHMTSMFFSG